jgi:hypothetical protein
MGYYEPSFNFGLDKTGYQAPNEKMPENLKQLWSWVFYNEHYQNKARNRVHRYIKDAGFRRDQERTRMQVMVEGGEIQGYRVLEDYDSNGVKKKSMDLGDLKRKYFGLWGDIETYLEKGIGRER